MFEQQAYEQEDWFQWRYEPGLEEMAVDEYIDLWFEAFGREYHRGSDPWTEK